MEWSAPPSWLLVAMSVVLRVLGYSDLEFLGKRGGRRGGYHIFQLPFLSSFGIVGVSSLHDSSSSLFV